MKTSSSQVLKNMLLQIKTVQFKNLPEISYSTNYSYTNSMRFPMVQLYIAFILFTEFAFIIATLK